MKVYFLKIWPLAATLVLLLAAAACERPTSFKLSGDLAFSSDSVRFDTLFTGVKSPTERLYIYNTSKSPIKISKIAVKGGQNSNFKLTLDGVVGQEHQDFLLNKGDSVYAFFDFRGETAGAGDQDFIDRLVITMEDREIEVVLFARVLDAHVFKSQTLDCFYVMPTDKPCVIDGVIYVAQGCTLQIPAGAKLYYSSQRVPYTDGEGNVVTYDFISQIYCDGTLLVDGQKGNEVLMTSFRLNERYVNSPGQWIGLRLGKYSRGSLVNYAIIENGSIGIRVDSTAQTPAAPKVVVSNTIVRNMANFCLLSLGFSANSGVGQFQMDCYNVLAYNAGQNVTGAYGGGLNRFVNCTFINNPTVGIPSNQPCVAVTNNQDLGNNQYLVFPSYNEFQNCIIWGNAEEEFGTSLFDSGQPVLLLKNNLAKTKRDLFNNNGNVFGLDPRFKNASKEDYSLAANSPAIDRGLENAATPYRDLNNRPRPQNAKPDIGAYEFYP